VKVERKYSEFNPAIITLESQEELDIISDLVALAAGSGFPSEVEKTLYDLKHELARNGANLDYAYINPLDSKISVKVVDDED